jgi:hypothetical protein
MTKILQLNIYSLFILVVVILLSVFYLTLSLAGGENINDYGETLSSRATGPFESSNSRGRYALTKTIVEDKSVFLSRDMATFSLPDVVSYDGRYFSLFTPGVSFIAVPFYIAGKALGIEQVATYMVNVVFTLGNVLLILILTRKLTGSVLAGGLSALTFLLATNAFSYSQTLTQHPITTFLLLLILYISVYAKGGFSMLIAGALFGIGLLIDLPNALILLPAIIFNIGKSIFYSNKNRNIVLSFDFRSLLLFVGVLPFVLGFGYYNQITTGSPYKIAQIIGRVTSLEEAEDQDKKILKDQYEEVEQFRLPFYTRLTPNGLFILTVSNERGVFYYSPILIFGLIGMVMILKNNENNKFGVLALSCLTMILVTYSMFGDPWGGWSFGARYMIPGNAILSIFLGTAFVKLASKPWFSTAFFALLLYSLSVNALGTLTTTAVPPKQEAVNLVNPKAYTYEYNLTYLMKNQSSSYLYNSRLADKFTLSDYYIFIISTEALVFISFYYYYLVISKRR